LIGETLAHYRITAAIGAGGMGEVYRATDMRLARDVAVKLLPAAVSADPERVARFEREAKLLASLNHPNIAHVYGFESATRPDGSIAHWLAMELVPGEDLAHRLRRGPIPIEEAIAVARQIAEGLEAAHERGIVHRDLKPANVKVTPDGVVKILDFGLAKAWSGDADSPVAGEPALSHSPTMTQAHTAAGMILGTAAYMSPEQARGRSVDKRADIWAFGVVCFQMLSGRPPFEGDTVSDVLAAVLKIDPDWTTLPAGTPTRLRELLRRCLERDVRQRLRDIGEARVILSDAGLGAGSPAESPLPEAAPRRSAALPWIAAALIAVAAAATGIGVGTRLSPPPPRGVTRLSIPLPPGQVLSGSGGPVVSRDGRRVAYTARDATGVTRLYVRALDHLEAGVIPESEGAHAPFFSPDGSRVGFFAGCKIVRYCVVLG
jgi:serine/threonine protein kinase